MFILSDSVVSICSFAFVAADLVGPVIWSIRYRSIKFVGFIFRRRSSRGAIKCANSRLARQNTRRVCSKWRDNLVRDRVAVPRFTVDWNRVTDLSTTARVLDGRMVGWPPCTWWTSGPVIDRPRTALIYFAWTTDRPTTHPARLVYVSQWDA